MKIRQEKKYREKTTTVQDSKSTQKKIYIQFYMRVCIDGIARRANHTQRKNKVKN